MKNYIYVTGLISFARQGSHRPRPTTNALKTHSTYDEWRRCAFGSHIAKLVRNVATVSDVSKDFQMFLSITKISYIYTVKRKPTKRQWGTIRDVWMMHYRCCTGATFPNFFNLFIITCGRIESAFTYFRENISNCLTLFYFWSYPNNTSMLWQDKDVRK